MRPVIYPLSLDQARYRQWRLEGEMHMIDATLRHSPTVDLDRHREALQAEYDALDEALTTLDRVRELPICTTGKLAHDTQDGAVAHARAQRLVGRPDPRPDLLNAYLCHTCWYWHVGHRREVL